MLSNYFNNSTILLSSLCGPHIDVSLQFTDFPWRSSLEGPQYLPCLWNKYNAVI